MFLSSYNSHSNQSVHEHLSWKKVETVKYWKLVFSIGIYEIWQEWALCVPFILFKTSFHVFKNMSESLKKVRLEVCVMVKIFPYFLTLFCSASITHMIPDTSNLLYTTYIASGINLWTIHHRKEKRKLAMHHIKADVYDDVRKVTQSLV